MCALKSPEEQNKLIPSVDTVIRQVFLLPTTLRNAPMTTYLPRYCSKSRLLDTNLGRF